MYRHGGHLGLASPAIRATFNHLSLLIAETIYLLVPVG